MSLELLIFLIVATVAIFSSSFMLASRNAVHSALFLVTTMICLAFFYLILNAPFLAMVQITVYAGAIMVLFLFVIMLLGAEKLGTAPTRYRWLSVGAVGLAALFMVTAFVAVVQGNVSLLKPVAHNPRVRVINVDPGQTIAVYADGVPLTTGLAFGKDSPYVELPAGTHTVVALVGNADGTPANPNTAKTLLSNAFSLGNETTTTLVAAATRWIDVPENLTAIDDDLQYRYIGVNALNGSDPADLLEVDPANASNFQVAAPRIPYGQFSAPVAQDSGAYNFAWQSGGKRLAYYAGQTIAAGSAQLFILAPDPVVPGQTVALNYTQQTQPSFGSPQQIGQQLFSAYLLPFELVSLLLLAAMVGAIVLTRDEFVRRERKRVVVSRTITRLNQPADRLSVRPMPNTTLPANTQPEPTSESAAD